MRIITTEDTGSDLLDGTQPISLNDSSEELENKKRDVIHYLQQNFRTTLVEIWRSSAPLMFSGLSVSISAFNGIRLLAHYGPNYDAAGTPIQAVTILVMGTALTLTMSANIYVSGLVKDHTNMGKTVNAVAGGLTLALIVGPLAMVTISQAPRIFSYMDPAIVKITKDYFRTYQYAAVPAVLAFCCTQILIGMGDTLPTGVLNIISSLVIIFLQYGWLEGKFSFPQEGAYGLGKAIALGNVILAAPLLAYLIYKLWKNSELRSNFSYKEILEQLKDQFLLGLLIDIAAGLEIGAIFGMSSFVTKKLDMTSITMFTMAAQYLFLTMPVQLSFRDPISAMIGNLRGVKNSIPGLFNSLTLDQQNLLLLQVKQRANQILYGGVFSVTVMSILIFALAVSAPNLLTKFFAGNSVDDISANKLRGLFAIIYGGQIFDGIRNTYSSAYFGNKHKVVPIFCSAFFVLGMNLGLAYAALEYDFGLLGMMAVFSSMMILSTAVSEIYWRFKHVNTFTQIQSEPAITEPRPTAIKTKWQFFRLPCCPVDDVHVDADSEKAPLLPPSQSTSGSINFHNI